MKNIVVFALNNNYSREALLALQRDKFISIKEWLGDDNGSGVITFDYANFFTVNKVKAYYGVCDSEIYEKVYKNLYMFVDTFARTGAWPIYEAVNIFNMLVNFFYTMFKNNEIEVIIWGDIPHFGLDYLAREVADAMGIKTVMLIQSFYPNKFFAILDIDDIGYFDRLKNGETYLNVSLENKFKNEIVIADHEINDKSVKSVRKNINEVAENSVINYISNFKKSIREIKTPIVSTENFNNKDLLDEKKIGLFYSIFKPFQHLYCEGKYQINVQKYVQTEIDLTFNYVYFPLHLQPELSTSVLGGVYCDQLLALERLSRLIPSAWKIYVKEHPMQTYYMRETNFFRRLSLIPNVVFVDKKYDTYDLIENSRFVATITGSAGWEAICGGKNTLVFGKAWYKLMPGVFEYSDSLELEEILTYKINHSELEEKYSQLIGKAYDGYITGIYYGNGLSNSDEYAYSDEKNNLLLYDAFKKIFEKI